MAAIKTLSINELSELIDVPAKTIRRVLRANSEKESQPGRGARWTVNANDVDAIKALIEKQSAKSGTVFQVPSE